MKGINQWIELVRSSAETVEWSDEKIAMFAKQCLEREAMKVKEMKWAS